MNDFVSGDRKNDPAVYQTLLESTRAIPWKIDWKTMRFSYIGPQIEELLGWKRNSWRSLEDWAARIIEEDRDKTVNFCVSQCEAGNDHEADYRALTASGDYIWIRDVVHIMRNDDGNVESLVGFMFDISERKKTEQELVRLKQELEELTYTDSLTGIGNRRLFDSLFEKEWANACRQRQPLSMVLIDIDYFKQFNDHYGHVQGDSCLKLVADTLRKAVNRPREFLGRIGGEEFAIVLPESDEKIAKMIADRCRQLIIDDKIPHPDAVAEEVLTISLGVSTIIPTADDQPMDFVEKVDRLLYSAKQHGRNQVAYG